MATNLSKLRGLKWQAVTEFKPLWVSDLGRAPLGFPVFGSLLRVSWPRRTSSTMLGWLGLAHCDWLEWSPGEGRGTRAEGEMCKHFFKPLFALQLLPSYGSKQVTWPNSESRGGEILPLDRRKHKVASQRAWMQRGKKIWGHLPLSLNKWSSDQEGAQFLGFTCCFNWGNILFLLSKKVEDLKEIQCTLLFYWSTSPWYYLPKFWFIIMEPSFSVLPKKLNRRFKNQIFEIC